MTLDEFSRQLGGLLGNLLSLEFAIRAFLQRRPSARPLGIPYGTDIYSYPAGADLPENELTSYDSLGQLIDRYNGEIAGLGCPPIDRALVEIRDALVHGRVSGALGDDNLRLLKFSRPDNRRVSVTFNQVLSSAWFAAQKARVYDALVSVPRN